MNEFHYIMKKMLKALNFWEWQGTVWGGGLASLALPFHHQLYRAIPITHTFMKIIRRNYYYKTKKKNHQSGIYSDQTTA